MREGAWRAGDNEKNTGEMLKNRDDGWKEEIGSGGRGQERVER